MAVCLFLHLLSLHWDKELSLGTSIAARQRKLLSAKSSNLKNWALNKNTSPITSILHTPDYWLVFPPWRISKIQKWFIIRTKELEQEEKVAEHVTCPTARRDFCLNFLDPPPLPYRFPKSSPRPLLCLITQQTKAISHISKQNLFYLNWAE